MRELNESEKQALRDAKQVVIHILEGMRGAIIRLLPFALRVGCMGVAVYGAALAFESTRTAYGSDVAALIPATLIAVFPLALAISLQLSWGGLLGSGLLSLAVAGAMPLLPAVVRTLIVMAIIGVPIMATVFGNSYSNEGAQNETWEQSADLVD